MPTTEPRPINQCPDQCPELCPAQLSKQCLALCPEMYQAQPSSSRPGSFLQSWVQVRCGSQDSNGLGASSGYIEMGPENIGTQWNTIQWAELLEQQWGNTPSFGTGKSGPKQMGVTSELSSGRGQKCFEKGGRRGWAGQGESDLVVI